MKKSDIEHAFAQIKPDAALEGKVMRLTAQEKSKVRRRMHLPVMAAAVLVLALVSFGSYTILKNSTSESQSVTKRQSVTEYFLVKSYAANGDEIELTKDNTALMAYTDPGLPLKLESIRMNATSFQVRVTAGTLWSGNEESPVARGNACVLPGDEMLYWSAKMSDGTYAPSGLVIISAYNGDDLISELVVSIRELNGGGYAARVIDGVAQTETKDGSIYLEGKISNLVYIDAPVFGTTEIQEKTASTYTAMRGSLLEESFFNFFGKGHSVKSYRIFDENSDIIINGETFHTCRYEFTNGDELYVSGDYADFSSSAGASISQSIQNPSIPYDDGTDQEWEFASKKEAFAEVKDALTQMGINVSDQYQVCSFDYLTLERKNLDLRTYLTEDQIADEEAAGNLRTNWSTADNCYYFILRQDINGTPMSDQSYGTENAGEFSFGTNISVIYTKDGIVSLVVGCPKIIESVELKDAATISLEDALALYADERAESKSGAIRTIHEVEYVYLPVAKGLHGENGFDLTPCWALGMPSLWGGIEWHFVNAITGEMYESIIQKSLET